MLRPLLPDQAVQPVCPAGGLPPQSPSAVTVAASPFSILAVWFFLGTTLLSTALSGALSVSVWGEVPGQDGYPAYTIIAYVLLFAVVATHLKTTTQLWRLLGAFVVMGVLISGYAILQHYGNDFLDLTETTGGGTRRVTSFMGNAIFAGAVMMMAIPMAILYEVGLIMARMAHRKALATDAGLDESYDVGTYPPGVETVNITKGTNPIAAAVLIGLHPGRIQQVIMGKLGFKPVNLLCQFVSLGTQSVLGLEMQRRGLVLLTKRISGPTGPEP